VSEWRLTGQGRLLVEVARLDAVVVADQESLLDELLL
jgi:hypothetical protein